MLRPWRTSSLIGTLRLLKVKNVVCAHFKSAISFAGYACSVVWRPLNVIFCVIMSYLFPFFPQFFPINYFLFLYFIRQMSYFPIKLTPITTCHPVIQVPPIYQYILSNMYWYVLIRIDTYWYMLNGKWLYFKQQFLICINTYYY